MLGWVEGQLAYLSLKITMWVWSHLGDQNSMRYTLTRSRKSVLLLIRFTNKAGCQMEFSGAGNARLLSEAVTKLIKEEL